MRIHIAADHAGFELRERLIAHLTEAGHDVVDHGYKEYDKLDAYPPVCFAAAEATVAEPGSLGIVIGGSGNGEQMAANKVRGIRAALVWNESTAELARQHNNANVISIGARQHTIEEATRFVDIFVATGYDESSRHQSRIEMMAAYEDGQRTF
ncbi:ribose-5-phosphate isomerase [Trueperella pecoris]|uniref:Ribose-5-phosphate isomerase B n=1 Tax=Trueperella pecoris TaxID=2733571 RepID=A0A7M1QVT3_9ACTO|nr:ribose-5-phosphate isomerase [Trueperella pecoris]QOQ39137.1 ribose-5-phosphate isomerase [Trueperella pecoris]QOR46232.1 ribose-5-phosphate isomerase [Trueperella pecoris]QTG76057.1 ribose-5-phosphate isomerase [Trueperella pecoris]